MGLLRMMRNDPNISNSQPGKSESNIQIEQNPTKQIHRPVAYPGIRLTVCPTKGEARYFNPFRPGATNPRFPSLTGMKGLIRLPACDHRQSIGSVPLLAQLYCQLARHIAPGWLVKQGTQRRRLCIC